MAQPKASLGVGFQPSLFENFDEASSLAPSLPREHEVRVTQRDLWDAELLNKNLLANASALSSLSSPRALKLAKAQGANLDIKKAWLERKTGLDLKDLVKLHSLQTDAKNITADISFAKKYLADISDDVRRAELDAIPDIIERYQRARSSLNPIEERYAGLKRDADISKAQLENYALLLEHADSPAGKRYWEGMIEGAANSLRSENRRIDALGEYAGDLPYLALEKQASALRAQELEAIRQAYDGGSWTSGKIAEGVYALDPKEFNESEHARAVHATTHEAGDIYPELKPREEPGMGDSRMDVIGPSIFLSNDLGIQWMFSHPLNDPAKVKDGYFYNVELQANRPVLIEDFRPRQRFSMLDAKLDDGEISKEEYDMHHRRISDMLDEDEARLHRYKAAVAADADVLLTEFPIMDESIIDHPESKEIIVRDPSIIKHVSVERRPDMTDKDLVEAELHMEHGINPKIEKERVMGLPAAASDRRGAPQRVSSGASRPRAQGGGARFRRKPQGNIMRQSMFGQSQDEREQSPPMNGEWQDGSLLDEANTAAIEIDNLAANISDPEERYHRIIARGFELAPIGTLADTPLSIKEVRMQLAAGEIDPAEAYDTLSRLKQSRAVLEGMLPNFTSAYKGVKAKRRRELEDIRKAADGGEWRAGDIIPGVRRMPPEEFARDWGKTTHATVALDGKPFESILPPNVEEVQYAERHRRPAPIRNRKRGMFFQTTRWCRRLSRR